jgi:hypothetical protein
MEHHPVFNPVIALQNRAQLIVPVFRLGYFLQKSQLTNIHAQHRNSARRAYPTRAQNPPIAAYSDHNTRLIDRRLHIRLFPIFIHKRLDAIGFKRGFDLMGDRITLGT